MDKTCHLPPGAATRHLKWSEDRFLNLNTRTRSLMAETRDQKIGSTANHPVSLCSTVFPAANR